jgi:hypothetical protein
LIRLFVRGRRGKSTPSPLPVRHADYPSEAGYPSEANHPREAEYTHGADDPTRTR